MNNARKNAEKSPVLTAIIVALFSVAAFSLPVSFSGKTVPMALYYSVQIGVRALVSVICAIYAHRCGFGIFSRVKKAAVLPFTVAFLVCVNNFPFIGVFSGNVVYKSGESAIIFILYCLSVGVSEEFVFRGVILPLFLLKFEKNPRRDFLATLCSAALFSLCHLGNLFGGASIGETALQVGYTFLTGAMFGAVMIYSENVILPSFLHFVYDLGGLSLSYKVGILEGNAWDTATVIMTAVIGVAALVYFCVKLLKKNQSKYPR